MFQLTDRRAASPDLRADAPLPAPSARRPSVGVVRSRVAGAIAIVAISAFVVGTAVDPRRDLAASAMFVGVVASSGPMGVLLIARVPRNPIGSMLLASACLMSASVCLGAYGVLGGLAIPPWPGAALAATVNDAIFLYPIVIALVGVPLVFPDRRLRFDRARYVGQRRVDAFSPHLRDQVDLGRSRAETVASIEGALSPAHVALWLRGPAGAIE